MGLSATLGLAIILFASTNIDDIFILLGFFADPRFRAMNIIIGQYLGISALVIISVVGSLISLVLAPAYVGLLGVLPILIGIKKLHALRGGNDEATPTHVSRSSMLAQIASVAAVTIANGGDNIGIYTPLFAAQDASKIALIIAVFTVMTALWLVIAHWMVNHRTIGAPLRRYGHVVVPFVLIALGGIILYEAGSFELLQ